MLQAARSFATTNTRWIAFLGIGVVCLWASGCKTYPTVTATGNGYAKGGGTVVTTTAPTAVAATTTNWYDQTLTATGDGAPPARATSAAQRRLLAKRAAITEARRNLAEKLVGVNITSRTTVKDFMTEDDTIRSSCNAFIAAATVNAVENADGSYTATVTVDLNGLRSAFPSQTTAVVAVAPTTSVRGGGGRGKLMALRGAKLDAQRNLVEKIYGAHVKSQTSVTNFEVDYDRILSSASGLMRWAEEVSSNYDPESGEAEVTLRLDGKRVKELVKLMKRARGY
ncbi:LPP20 family lipoprotein [Candidatus Sumerlaeota bacterium]